MGDGRVLALSLTSWGQCPRGRSCQEGGGVLTWSPLPLAVPPVQVMCHHLSFLFQHVPNALPLKSSSQSIPFCDPFTSQCGVIATEALYFVFGAAGPVPVRGCPFTAAAQSCYLTQRHFTKSLQEQRSEGSRNPPWEHIPHEGARLHQAPNHLEELARVTDANLSEQKG